MRNRWRFSLGLIGVVALAMPALPATAAGTAPVAAAPPATIEEAFDDLSPEWLPAAGTWEAADGVARVVQPGSSRGSILALTGRGLDGTATVTATFASAGGGASAWAGFTVRRSGTTDDYTQSGYTVFVRNNGELALIRAAGDGQVAVLGTAQTDARPGSAPVTVSVSLDGERMRVGLGGAELAAPLIEVTDAAFSGSGFAFAAHRDVRMAVDSVRLAGVVDRAEPVPTDCVAWSGEPATDAGRGEVLVSDARVAAVSARITVGEQPQASAYARLLTAADTGLERAPAPPTTFFVPFFYNDPTAHRAARDGLQNDANTAYELALAYRLSGDARYGAQAARFIDAWTSTVECVRTREDSALAFSYHFPAFVHAAELLRGTSAWSPASEAVFAGFLRETATPVAGSILHRTNNWGSWALETTTAAAAYLDDEAGLAAAHARAVELLEHQIDENGHLPEEVDRNNGVGDYGIWYTHFSLLPLFLVAETLSAHGYDVHDHVNANGRGLADAADAAAGWVADPASFPYYTGDLTKLANVRTIDYLRDAGIMAHSMSYFELAQNHYPTGERAALLAEEGPMTTIHSAPHLSLTHGGLADVTAAPGEGEPSEPGEGEPGAGEPGAGEPGAGTPGGAGTGPAGAPTGEPGAGATGSLAASGGDVSPATIVLAVAMTLVGLVLVVARVRRREAAAGA
ncbi:alginate lyase family protein [Microbacterium sp. 2P01SA-2]|uniref:alginate lyase family protein n=1 Tax=unclassified Microbacterium TaxID=2609290 RepID=UPI0039A0C3DA